jgi:phospholipid/cholesterol/gamma-HCH transport system substrate-binding protein
MEIRARYVLVGLFTLAVIAGGFAFVYWLQTVGGVGKRASYDIHFSNTVSGLLRGSPVLFNGIRVGEVTGLRLVPDNPRAVDTTIAIDEHTPVRSDTLVSLEFQGLTGVAVVTLTGGSENAPAPTVPLQGGRPVLTASEAAGESMSESARRVLARLDKILADNTADVRNIMSNVSTFSEALGRNSSKVDGIVAGLERMTAGGKGSGVFYSLNAVPAPANPAPLGKQVAVADPSALMAYDSEKVLSQGQAGQVEPINGLKWADTVPKLMQAKIVQSFENAGALGEVNRPIEGSMPDFQLLTEIRRFQVVQGPQPVAEAEISAKLVGNDGHIVGARVFSAKEPVQSKEDAEAARALSTAFSGIVSNLIGWTRDSINAPAAAAPAPKEQAAEQTENEKPEPKEKKRSNRQH